jgi:hypothetical protein
MSLSRLQQVEKSILKDSEHRKPKGFMEEYLHLGHMELIQPQERQETLNETNYLPHNVHVIFDASARNRMEDHSTIT